MSLTTACPRRASCDLISLHVPEVPACPRRRTPIYNVVLIEEPQDLASSESLRTLAHDENTWATLVPLRPLHLSLDVLVKLVGVSRSDALHAKAVDDRAKSCGIEVAGCLHEPIEERLVGVDLHRGFLEDIAVVAVEEENAAPGSFAGYSGESVWFEDVEHGFVAR